MLRVFFLTGVLLLQYFPVSSQDAAIPAAAATSASPASVDIAAGKTLFKNQCAACHNKNMKDKLLVLLWGVFRNVGLLILKKIYIPG